MQGRENSSQMLDTTVMNTKVDPITLTIEEEDETGRHGAKLIMSSQFEREAS